MHKKYSFISNTIYFFSYVWNTDKKIVLVQILLTLLSVILPTLELFVPKILVDDISTKISLNFIVNDVIFLILIIITLKILISLLTYISNLNSDFLAKKFDLLFVNKVMTLDFEILENATGRNEYQKAKNSFNENGVYGYINSIFNLLTNILGFLVYVRIIAELNIWIIPLLLAIESLGGVSAFIVRNLDQKTKSNRAAADRKLRYINNVAKDYIAAKDIKVYTMSNYLLKLGKQFLDERKYWTNKQYMFFLINNFTTALIGVVTTGGTYGYLIYQIIRNNMGAGEVVLYLGVIIGFAKWLSGIVDNIDVCGKANRGISDIRSFFDLKSLFQGDNILCEKTTENYIEIENVTYSYLNSDTQIINDVSLKIKPCEKIAIVGLNGAGKTTLIKLICGLYKPSTGAVLINGVDSKNISNELCFSNFSVVFQDIRWLPLSILENITMEEKLNSDETKVWKVLEIVGLAEKVRCLPFGINTNLMKNLNSDGVNFSGGEMQKIAMARALYKNAPVFVLDEPTAALDPIAENEIYLQYNKILKDKTAIFVSHRLASTKFCDRIIFLKDGAIIEEGTHEELMNLGGAYAALFRIQSKYYEEKAI